MMLKLLLLGLLAAIGLTTVKGNGAHDALFSDQTLSTDETFKLLKELRAQGGSLPDFLTILDHLIQANEVSIERCQMNKLTDLWRVVAIPWAEMGSKSIGQYIQEKANLQYETCREKLGSQVYQKLAGLNSATRSFLSRINKSLVKSHISPDELKSYKVPYGADAYQKVGALTKDKVIWTIVFFINHLNPVEKARVGLSESAWFQEMLQLYVKQPCQSILGSFDNMADFFDAFLKPNLAGSADTIAWEVTNPVLLCRTVLRQDDVGKLVFELFSRIKITQ